MKGTEKQVAYAQAIIERIEEVIANAENACAEHPMIQQIKANNSRIVENIKKESAWNIIEDFQNIVVTSDWGADMKVFTTMCKMAKACGRNYL